MGRRDIPSPPKSKSGKDQKTYRSQFGNDDKDFTSFQEQLEALGLELKDVPGDGNCLFRALGDQLDGHSHNHLTHRRDVCEYMLKHREDFEPFIEDEVPFQQYIDNLSQSGTYAGNDAIVAFARLHEVVIVIHQLNSPLWNIQGTEKPNARQLHIAYHNGVHYSSVRKIGEDSQLPANIRLPPESKCFDQKRRSRKCKYDEDEISAMVLQVATATGSKDVEGIYAVLEDNEFDVEATIDVVLSLKDLLKGYGNQKELGIWGPNGSGTRLFGNTELESKSSELYVVPEWRIQEHSSRKAASKYHSEKPKQQTKDSRSEDKTDSAAKDSKDFNCLNL